VVHISLTVSPKSVHFDSAERLLEYLMEIEKLSFPSKDRILGLIKGASGGI